MTRTFEIFRLTQQGKLHLSKGDVSILITCESIYTYIHNIRMDERIKKMVCYYSTTIISVRNRAMT
jgi:hypothetical protein